MSSIAIHEELEELAQEIKRKAPDVRMDFRAFPSGAVMLDVHRNDRLVVLAYSPTHRLYSVAEVGDDDGYLAAYQFNYADLAPAVKQLLDLLGIP